MIRKQNTKPSAARRQTARLTLRLVAPTMAVAVSGLAALSPGVGAASLASPQAAHTASSRASFMAGSCRFARTAVRIRLVLSNKAPMPRVLGNEGGAVEVVSSDRGNQMTFPTARPSKAVCEISQHRSRDGTATVVYQPLCKATITFSSTYAHATEAMMPAMLGRLVVPDASAGGVRGPGSNAGTGRHSCSPASDPVMGERTKR
jgi:hypothetical protein